MKARDKLVMYCDTKSEWMMTAIGCFKFNFSLVTIYTNLGEDGVTYGINQTEANYVCTSQELLPKLLSILDKVNWFLKFQVYFFYERPKYLFFPNLNLAHLFSEKNAPNSNLETFFEQMVLLMKIMI